MLIKRSSSRCIKDLCPICIKLLQDCGVCFIILNFRHNVNKVCNLQKQFSASTTVFKTLPWLVSSPKIFKLSIGCHVILLYVSTSHSPSVFFFSFLMVSKIFLLFPSSDEKKVGPWHRGPIFPFRKKALQRPRVSKVKKTLYFILTYCKTCAAVACFCPLKRDQRDFSRN